MNSDLFGPEPDGATPLSPEDYLELIPKRLFTRADLNLAEALNILSAQNKYLGRQLTTEIILDDLFVRQLHRDMFQRVWKWAGRYRTRNLNLGVDFTHVSQSVAALAQDARRWLEDRETDEDTVAIELHHRLVAIHPFINGNGRVSRMMADLLITSLSREEFSWGGGIKDPEAMRFAYLNALRRADDGDLQPLLRFARG